MNYLLVVAHPDDEALGAGATMHKLTKEGHRVDVCILCSEVNARTFRPEDGELNSDMLASTDLLGVSHRYEGIFPNIEMNTIPHLKMVQFIEASIKQSQPDVVITHHPSDTNNDHLHTSLTCQAAIRLFQRNPSVKPLQELWFMEVLSSTEWSVNTAMNRFEPNTFVEIGEDGLAMKLKALETYRDIMRPYPHPRSEEAVRGLAAYRGTQSGCNYAEAFECVLRRIV